MASLCHEYKIDWLLKKIENYIEKVTPMTYSTNVGQLLRYLKLASLYGFDKAMEKLVQLIDESFITLQMHEEFTRLNTSVKILLARRRLWSLLGSAGEREKMVNTSGIALLSVFADSKQEPFKFEDPEIMKPSSFVQAVDDLKAATSPSASQGVAFGNSPTTSQSGLFGSTNTSDSSLFGSNFFVCGDCVG